MRGVAILGSTGSIGKSALRVLERHPDRFRVVALTARTNANLLREQIARFRPQYSGLVAAAEGAPQGCTVGEHCLLEAATHPGVDIVLNAVVGAAGTAATLAALRCGKRVALANKETLVVAGHLAMRLAREYGGEIVPVDSEHSAILQCIVGQPRSSIAKLVLTASGGPFRDWSVDRLRRATPEDALRHPTWDMGRKITVDSATLANKGLEVIEAHYLFDVPYDAIEVVVHPQSIVHSLVEFVDGSVLAQLGVPSMELPILFALTFPERLEDFAMPRLDLIRSSPLTFEAVRLDDFPALQLGLAAGRRGGAAPAVFNAANEVAVARFLDGTLSFPGIPMAIESALEALGDLPGESLEDVMAADAEARAHVRGMPAC